MKIVKKGTIPPKRYEYQFECKSCHSIVQAEEKELIPVGSQYNEYYYAFICPFCNHRENISDSEMTKVGVY